MKVVYAIGARFAGGGIGTIAYHAVQGLHRDGSLQRLLCGSYRATELPEQRIRALGPPSRVLRKLATFDPSGRLWHAHSLLFDAWAARRLEAADIFHVWGNDGLHSLRRAKELGMMTVVQRASTHPACQARLLREEHERWGLPFHLPAAGLARSVAEISAADYVLIPSEFVRRSFIEEGFPEQRLLEIPFGADTARFRPPAHRARRPFRVLFAGQIGVRKGVPYLLEAWQRLGWRDAELWLAGRVEPNFGPILARWQGLAGLKRLEYVPDPAPLYQQVDLFAFPTVEEGSALVTYEALACGLPVVTTPNAGSVVRDGLDGYLVPIRDAGALAERLERLRLDEELRREMGRSARRQAERFTWTGHGQTLAQRYRGLASGRRTFETDRVNDGHPEP